MLQHRIAPLILFFSFSAHSMTLDQVFKEAVTKNESIPTADENLVQAEEYVKQSRGAWIPTLNLYNTHFWQEHADPVPPATTGAQAYQPETKLTLRQQLE